MASRIRRPRKGARVETYLSAARELSAYAPKLKKYRKRKTLKGYEKSQIARYISKIGRTTGNLYPLTKKQQKNIPKSEWVSPSIPAIKINQLEKLQTHVATHRRGVLHIREGKRQWIFWPLSMAAHIPKTDPFARIQYLVELAFDTYDIFQMHLWNTQGIAGFGYAKPELFFRHYQQSLEPGKIGSGGATIPRAAQDWLLGIAFMVK